MDETLLEEIGLSKAEIRIYISLLELGESTSGPLIQKANLQSSVVHRAIKELIAKGLVTYIVKGKDRHYRATGPHTLVNYIENKKKRIEDLIPELVSRQNRKKEDSRVEMYEGKRAIFTLLNDLVYNAGKGEEYLSFSLIEPHKDQEIVDFYQRYNLRRREKKLKVKVLVNIKIKPIYEKNYSRELLQKAHVRYSSFHFPQGIVVFRDNVVLLNWGENPTAVKITNVKTALQFREFFLEAYNEEKDAYS